MRARLMFVGVAALVALISAAPETRAAFPGTNGDFVFERFSTETGRDVWTMNADGSGIAQLTSAAGGDAWPEFSPDGTKIAFDGTRPDGRQIYVMDADGTNVTRVTNAFSNSSPSFHPDGTKLVFLSFRGGQWDLYSINLDGTGETNLTQDPAADGRAAWSPDGTKLAYSSDGDIHIIDVDGTNRTRLTFHTAHDALPDWSPDGSRIAWYSERDGAAEIYAMNADGSNQVNMTGNPAGDFHPAWSPDGTSLAFASNRAGATHDIFVMPASGGPVTRLTDDEQSELALDWGPAADSDGDGLVDDADPDTVGDAVAELPAEAFRSEGHRSAIDAQLESAEAAIQAGRTEVARRMLERLRAHLDGCGTTADGDDWITDCAAQIEIRALLDTLIATLA